MKPAPGVCTDEKVWDVKAAASEVGEELKKTLRQRGRSVSQPTRPTPPGPDLQAEREGWRRRHGWRRGVGFQRAGLMLRIKQTVGMDNPIVAHSLAQPNISKSDWPLAPAE